MRIVAFITEGAVINRILTHLRRASGRQTAARACAPAPRALPSDHTGIQIPIPLWFYL